MPPAFDDFTDAFARFLESGRVGQLAGYCEPGVNTELFNIYRNGYFRSTIDTLVSNYPAVHALLGDELFRHLSKQFVAQFPPAFGSLVGYGDEFAMFLDDADISRQLPYLPDMARLDRGWLKVFFAADCEPLTPVSVTALINESGEAGSQHIALIPASTIVSLRYQITDVWQLLKAKGRLDKAVELARKPEQTLLWRAGPAVLIRALPAVEFVFFSSLNEGLSIEEAAENAMEENTKFDIDSFFSNLIAAGLLSQSTEQFRSVL